MTARSEEGRGHAATIDPTWREERAEAPKWFGNVRGSRGARPRPTRRWSSAVSAILPRQRQLLADGVSVELGTRAFDLLMVLIDADGALVTKDELLTLVWPGIFVDETNLKVQVFLLRRALGEDRNFIRTEFGRGYRFTAAIRRISAVAENPRPMRTEAPVASRGVPQTDRSAVTAQVYGCGQIGRGGLPAHLASDRNTRNAFPPLRHPRCRAFTDDYTRRRFLVRRHDTLAQAPARPKILRSIRGPLPRSFKEVL